MRIPKVYGKSKIEHCPFCGRIATQKNDSGLLVCPQHVNAQLEEIRCTCGSWLEQRSGKLGPYFNCLKCGNINFKRGMEMKIPIAPRGGVSFTKKGIFNVCSTPSQKDDVTTIQSPQAMGYHKQMKALMANSQRTSPVKSFSEKDSYENKREEPIKKQPKEITISTNDVEYFD